MVNLTFFCTFDMANLTFFFVILIYECVDVSYSGPKQCFSSFGARRDVIHCPKHSLLAKIEICENLDLDAYFRFQSL